MTNTVSVLFVHHGGDVIRGSERCLLDLLSHMDRKRFRPLVWCNSETFAREVGRLGVRAQVDDFPVMFHYREPKFAPGAFAALLRKGRKLLLEDDVRLVHANGGAPVQWMLPLSRARSIPLVAHLHSPYDFADRALLGLHQASMIVGVSRAVVDPLAGDGVPPARIQVIYNGIDAHRLEAAGPSGLRAELGIAPDAVVAAFVGSLIHRKGVDLALRACARIAAEEGAADIHLLVVGEGPERSRLVALAQGLGLMERVHFIGESTAVGAIYRDDVDIGILPSRAEAFGLTLAEMGHFGLPVIGSAVGGIPEVIAHRRTGLLVPPDDVESLATAIRKLASNPALRAAKGCAGRARTGSEFSIQRNVEEFEGLYTALLERPKHEFGWLSGGVSPGVYVRGAWKVIERKLRDVDIQGGRSMAGEVLRARG